MFAGRHPAGGLELSTEFSFERSAALPLSLVSSALASREDDIPKNRTANKATNQFIIIAPQSLDLPATQNAHHFQLSASSGDLCSSYRLILWQIGRASCRERV